VIETPEGVQLCACLAADNKQVTIVINHTRLAQTIEMTGTVYDHLSGQSVKGSLALPAYGVAVLT
jgi:hypothetical protein